MMRAIRGPAGWSAFVLVVVLVIVLGWLLAAAAPAQAHAELVDTDPHPGAVLERLPDVVTFTFSEDVRQVPDGVHVYDAQGDELAASASTRDEDLLVTITDPVESGTVVVAWRVVSVDGHPIAGSLTFSIGAPSADTDTPNTTGAPRSVSIALSLSRWPAYVGLLLAAGLVWFLALVVPPEIDSRAGVRTRLRGIARWAALVSIVAWLTGLLLDAMYLRGTGFPTVFESATVDALPRRELVATAVVVAGLAGAVLARGAVASLAALVALVPEAYVGHSVAMAHAQLNVVVDGFHLVAAAAWLGGLVGLVVVLRGTSGRSDVALLAVTRFSALAASVLAALVLAGSVLAWQLVGSWHGLVESGYGQVLLSKIALVTAAVGVATYNRFRLVPHAAAQRGVLTRTVSVEALLLVAVVLVTGFLVQKNPPAGVGGDGPPAATPVSGQTDLGGLQATVSLDPAAVGSNTVTIEIDNSSGSPAELFTPPTLRVLGEDADVGDVPLAPSALGTYQGTVQIPLEGAWRFQVSVRVDEFTNPVGTVELDVVRAGLESAP
jgi:copper transport protein